MARDLRVNAIPGSEEESEPIEGFPDVGFAVDPMEGASDRGKLSMSSARIPSAEERRSSLGPCLYLGPRGQRCALPAVEGGFCSKHRPGAKEAGSPVAKRIVGAVAAVLGILWPYITDLVREILRWIHHH